MSDKKKKPVNKLYMCRKYSDKKVWEIKHSEKTSAERVTYEEIDYVIKAIRNIVKNEPHKYHFIPAKAIMNELENVSQEFKEEQEKWKKDNSNLRNTGNYTLNYHNPLHVMNYEGWIKYYKDGTIDILDEKRILTTKLIKTVRMKNPTLMDWI